MEGGITTNSTASYRKHTPPTLKQRRLVKPFDKDIEIVIREALRRYKEGKQEHGELDLSTDKRDFLKEAEQELLDCINYCVFQILRLRRLRA